MMADAIAVASNVATPNKTTAPVPSQPSAFPIFITNRKSLPLHLQRPLDSDDETNRNQIFDENNDNSHQGLELAISNTSSGDVGLRWQCSRLPGSKNKPKHTVILPRESANMLQAHILEVSSGCDVFEAVATYASKEVTKGFAYWQGRF
ncbi:AT-hook motif nuclear-localized protein 23 [Abeliophyllum distichum]|uniref:AT-hook motif nuclear-localized protein 23 n=1 Tax=Abeliophyllum distichum TaxID=126358 RepID=A0ABD1VX97_9LAMI